MNWPGFQILVYESSKLQSRTSIRASAAISWVSIGQPIQGRLELIQMSAKILALPLSFDDNSVGIIFRSILNMEIDGALSECRRRFVHKSRFDFVAWGKSPLPLEWEVGFVVEHNVHKLADEFSDATHEHIWDRIRVEGFSVDEFRPRQLNITPNSDCLQQILPPHLVELVCFKSPFESGENLFLQLIVFVNNFDFLCRPIFTMEGKPPGYHPESTVQFGIG